MDLLAFLNWDWSLIGIKAFQLICCLSLLVVLHEGGHFFFAKISGVRVEKFYMFFNPYFHLFSTRDKWFAKLFPRIAANETEYGIGWIPLGGYVSISGMVDETKDAKDVGTEIHDYDFMAKPIWKRFLIMFGGVLVNFLTAIFLYIIIMFTWGQEILPMRNITGGLVYNQQAKEIGFRNGDIPVKTDDEPIESFDGNIFMQISEAKTVTVLRNGKELTLQMPEGGVSLLDMQHQPRFLSIPVPPVVGEVAGGTPARDAGLKPGMRIISLDGHPMEDATDVSTYLQSKDDYTLQVVAKQPAKETLDTLTMQLGEDLKMGVMWNTDFTRKYKTETVHYNILESIPKGCQYGWQTLSNYVISLKYLFSKEGAQSVGSFITIGSIFPDTWDWQRFWLLTAFISIILAVMNILPIPGLDGGHIMLLLYEGATRHQPSQKSLEYIEKAGMWILIAIMILAMGNDILRFIL